MPDTNSFMKIALEMVSIGGHSFLFGRGVSPSSLEFSYRPSVPFKEILGTFKDIVSPHSTSYSTTRYLLKVHQPSKDVGFQYTTMYTIYMGFPKFKNHILHIVTFEALLHTLPYVKIYIYSKTMIKLVIYNSAYENTQGHI